VNPFRVYEPDECGRDGYPLAWHTIDSGPGVKHLVREQADFRCVRCGHPYAPGDGKWSRCDELCMHGGPVRTYVADAPLGAWLAGDVPANLVTEAEWRVLTVHHLRLGDDAKRDLRWWNLAALCQRCHLQIQGKVVMERIWPWPHSDWFKPYAAGWYAWAYNGEDLTREETLARLDELLALEAVA
jgi:hypothetical protein